MDVIQPEGLTTNKSLVQDATTEYCDLVDLKQWEPDASEEKYQDKPLSPKEYNMEI